LALRFSKDEFQRNSGLLNGEEEYKHQTRDVTPFFRSESYESRLAASVSWQEDCEHHDQEKETALAGANRSENTGR